MRILPSLLALALSLALPLGAEAQTRTGRATLPPGPDVYRIEIDGMSLFRVTQIGDPNPPGELRFVRLELRGTPGTTSGDAQFVRVTETPPWFHSNRPLPDRENSIDIRRGDWVELTRLRGRPGAYRLAIHDRPDADGILRFQLMVEVRELDCARDNLCRRGNTGRQFIDFAARVPFSYQGQACNDVTTFRMREVDGRLLVDGRGLLSMDHASRSASRGQLELRAYGPHLQPIAADICIARSQPTLPIRPIPPELRRGLRDLQRGG